MKKQVRAWLHNIYTELPKTKLQKVLMHGPAFLFYFLFCKVNTMFNQVEKVLDLYVTCSEKITLIPLLFAYPLSCALFPVIYQDLL